MSKCSTIALFILIGILFLMTGCYLPHNNALVFASSTNVGLDISSKPVNAGLPNISFGYQGHKGVWMPLLANSSDEEGNLIPAQCGKDDNCHFKGSSNPDEDSYSILANFGLEYEKGAGGAIAEYIATGLAARDLARAGGDGLVALRAPATQIPINVSKAEFERIKQEILQYVSENDEVNGGRLNILIKGTELENDNKVLSTIGKPIDELDKVLDFNTYKYRKNLEALVSNIE